MLFLRLFLRAGPWFKLTGMAYSECPDVVGTAAVLDGAALALDLAKADVDERKAAVKCLTSLELQTVLAALQLLPAKQKGKSLSRKQLVNLMHNGLDSPSKVGLLQADAPRGVQHVVCSALHLVLSPAGQSLLGAGRPTVSWSAGGRASRRRWQCARCWAPAPACASRLARRCSGGSACSS